MTFRQKAIGFSAAVVFIVGILVALMGLSIQLSTENEERQEQVNTFSSGLRNAEVLATDLLLSGGERPLTQWRILSQRLTEQLEDDTKLVPLSAGLRRELNTRLDSMDKAFERLSQASVIANPTARAILVSQLQANKDALISRIAGIEAETRERESETYYRIMLAKFLILGLLLVLGVSHYFVTRRYLVSAYDQVSNAIISITENQLSVSVKGDRKDEIGGLLRRLDSMRRRLLSVAEEQESARLRAEELSRTKSRFVASVSHELRTPLTGLLGHLDLAARRNPPAELKPHLDHARTAGGHLLTLVNQVLDFSKIEAGHLILNPEPFDPKDLIERANSVFIAQAIAKGLSLEVSGSNLYGDWLVGDNERISQVVFNLMSNAIKFTNEGKVSLEYRVRRLDDQNARLTISVSDTGPGIPEEHQQRIFDDFAQVGHNSDATQPGTGLGLSISAQLIRQMGGEISVESTLGLGSQFRFELDMARVDPDAQTAPEAPLDGAEEPSYAVLVAEDVDANRMILVAFLRAAGHTVDESVDGEDCLGRLHAGHRYDAILMDINMPRLDGLEATRRIRGSGTEWAFVPIIGVTANAFEQQVRSYIDAGMDACISKPINWKELSRTLADTVSRRRAEAEALESQAVVVDAGEEKHSRFGPAEGDELIDIDHFRIVASCLGWDQAVANSRQILADAHSRSLPILRHGAQRQIIGQEAHALCGVAGNYGFRAVAAAARQVENTARNGDDTGQLVEELAVSIERTVARAAELSASKLDPETEVAATGPNPRAAGSRA